MKKILLIATFLTALSDIQAQSVIVNPDGTHSIVIDNGSTKTIVNPDGTHSTVVGNGRNTKTIVNPDGTHSTIIDNGNTKIIVNPDGTHSTVIDSGGVKTVVNPNKNIIKYTYAKDTTIIDTVKASIRADTIKAGPVTVIKCEGCGENSGKISSVSIGTNNTKNKQDNVDVSWFQFDLGVNSYIDKSNYGSQEVNDFVQLGAGNGEATEEVFSLRTFKSINVNIWPFMMKVNLIHHVLGLKTGLGIEMNNYRYSRNLTYVNSINKTYIKLDDIHFNKNKLFTEYLTVPVLLQLSTNPHDEDKSFHFSAGPTFGLLVKSRTKQKSAERGKVKNNNSFNLEKFRTSLRAEFGYGTFGIYGSYSLAPIHRYGLEQYPLSIGITLGM